MQVARTSGLCSFASCCFLKALFAAAVATQSSCRDLLLGAAAVSGMSLTSLAIAVTPKALALARIWMLPLPDCHFVHQMLLLLRLLMLLLLELLPLQIGLPVLLRQSALHIPLHLDGWED